MDKWDIHMAKVSMGKMLHWLLSKDSLQAQQLHMVHSSRCHMDRCVCILHIVFFNPLPVIFYLEWTAVGRVVLYFEHSNACLILMKVYWLWDVMFTKRVWYSRLISSRWLVEVTLMIMVVSQNKWYHTWVNVVSHCCHCSESQKLSLVVCRPLLSVWLHLFCGAGHEKRRGEQLMWSLAFRLYIGSFPCAQLLGPVHTAWLGWVFFVCI